MLVNPLITTNLTVSDNALVPDIYPIELKVPVNALIGT